ncbi:MAG: hypothetical protein WC683_11880 [bacterium]
MWPVFLAVGGILILMACILADSVRGSSFVTVPMMFLIVSLGFAGMVSLEACFEIAFKNRKKKVVA